MKRTSILKIIQKRKDDLEQRVRDMDNRNQFFMKIWEKRPHKSELSEEYLGKEPNSTYFHHILPKAKYPQAEFDEDNIILLTSDEHYKAEGDMYFYEEIDKRREKLKEKYNL